MDSVWTRPHAREHSHITLLFRHPHVLDICRFYAGVFDLLSLSSASMAIAPAYPLPHEIMYAMQPTPSTSTSRYSAPSRGHSTATTDAQPAAPYSLRSSSSTIDVASSFTSFPQPSLYASANASRAKEPLTPPLTGAFERKKLPEAHYLSHPTAAAAGLHPQHSDLSYRHQTLPSLAQFDRQISARHLASPRKLLFHILHFSCGLMGLASHPSQRRSSVRFSRYPAISALFTRGPSLYTKARA